jgi:hypothetical protein
MLAGTDLYTVDEISENLVSASQFVHLSKDEIKNALRRVFDNYEKYNDINCFESIDSMYVRAVMSSKLPLVFTPYTAFNAVEDVHGCFCALCGNISNHSLAGRYEDFLFKHGFRFDYFENGKKRTWMFASECELCRRAITRKGYLIETVLHKMAEHFTVGAGRKRLEENKDRFKRIRFDARRRATQSERMKA